jgi:VWFA-related protein
MRISAPLAAFLLTMLLGSAPAARQAQQPAAPAQPQPPPGQPAPAPATQEPARAQQPPIRTGINYVRVDAIVTDKQGNPVLDLKPEEFLISEDNKAQKIESFSVVKIDATSQMNAPLPTQIRTTSDEEIEAAKPDVRLFVLLLDDYHVRRGNDMSVRKPIIDFIQNQLAPADMVALMYPLTPVSELHFSRDRQGLISAVDHFEGRKFEYTPRNEFEEKYAYYPAATVEKIRNDVTMGALKGAAVKLGGMREGRKSIIFISEGFTSTLPPQLNDPIAAMPRLGNPARSNPSAQGPGDSVEFFNQADMLNDMREVFDTANRQNTSIYAVDPRGLAAFEYGVNEAVGLQADQKNLNASLDSLRILADNTDGRAIVNRNDLAVGMKQIIRDASGYYLLGYNSTQAPTDGKFHEIKVRVTRRGVDVRARKGYWAYTVDDVARATAPPTPGAPSAVMAALNSIAEPPRGRAARFWIGMAKGPDGSPRVTFAWEPMAPEDTQGRGAESGASRVMLTATAPDGRPVFRGKVPEEGAAPAAPVATTSSPPAAAGAAAPVSAGASATFDARPGQLQLRMVVENSRGQVMDSATQELTVPDFSKVQVSLSTPRVFKGRTVRELQAVKANANAAPLADRTFSRSERLLVRVDAYSADGAAPAISARLLNRGGTSMADIPVQAGAPGEGALELGLSALAAGDYVIEVNAKASTGAAQEFVAFKVSR